jgi:predicted dehydrogenase
MMCSSSRIPDSKNDVVIYGSDGRVVLKDSSRPTMGGELEVVSETENDTVVYEPDELALFKWQTESFNGAIQKNEEPAASGIDGLKIVQVTVAMIESASTGRTIKIDPLPAF